MRFSWTCCVTEAKAPDAWLPVLMVSPEVELDPSLMWSLTQLILGQLHVTTCDSVKWHDRGPECIDPSMMARTVHGTFAVALELFYLGNLVQNDR